MAVELLQTVSPPGYGRAYYTTTIQVVRQGVLRPAGFAQWEALTPGTESQYLGPLYGSPYGDSLLTFPQRADEKGLLHIWAPEPVRIELRVSVYGYPSVKQVADLQFTEDPGDTALDALATHIADPADPHAAAGYITLADADAVFLTPDEADELFLTQEEGDARYAQAGLSGITQDAADVRYVNVPGDSMTGGLKVTPSAGGPAVTVNQNSGGPNTGLALAYGDKLRWQWSLVQQVGMTPDLSDFVLSRYDANGNFIKEAFYINRGDGSAHLYNHLRIDGSLYFSTQAGPAASDSLRFGMEGLTLNFRRYSDSAVVGYVDTYGNIMGIGRFIVGSGEIDSTTGRNLTLNGRGSNISLNAEAGYVHPPINGGVQLGHPTLRWGNVFTNNADIASYITCGSYILAAGAIQSQSGTLQAGQSSGEYALYRSGSIDTYGNPTYTVVNHAGGILLQCGGSAQSVVIGDNTLSLMPATNGGPLLGQPSNRWAQIWTSAGAINSSSVETKEAITHLDPEDCVRAVLETDWVEFDYRADVPGKHQRGYVLGSPAHRVSDLFGLADRVSASPGSDLAVLACALQEALRRIEELEAN